SGRLVAGGRRGYRRRAIAPHAHPDQGAGTAPRDRRDELDELLAEVTRSVADLGREIHQVRRMLRELELTRHDDPSSLARRDPAERCWRDGLDAVGRAAGLHEHAARIQDDAGHPELAARERGRAAACQAAYARGVAAHPEWNPDAASILPRARTDGTRPEATP